jgi:hypothetical protein
MHSTYAHQETLPVFQQHIQKLLTSDAAAHLQALLDLTNADVGQHLVFVIVVWV